MAVGSAFSRIREVGFPFSMAHDAAKQARDQMLRLSAAVIGLLGIVITPVDAARTLQNVMVINGTCKKMSALDADLTSQCQGKLSSNIFSDSRSSFTFIVQPPGKAPLVFTFSGVGSAEVKQSADVAIQPVDQLITGGLEGKPISDKAVGLCRFTNPYKPDATFFCVAETGDGHYQGSFESDGSPPSTMRPSR